MHPKVPKTSQLLTLVQENRVTPPSTVYNECVYPSQKEPLYPSIGLV